MNIKILITFNPKKFIKAIGNLIASEESQIETSPTVVYYNTALIRKDDINQFVNGRIKRFIHSRITIPEETSLKDEVRQALAITETILVNPIPDFTLEDTFLKEAWRRNERTMTRWNEIVEALEKVSNYQISDIFQALWIFARLATGTLEQYQKCHDQIPEDPLDELYQFKMEIDEEEQDNMNTISNE